MYQLWLFIVLLCSFSGNAFADRGDNTPHYRSESSYEHPIHHHSADLYQWNQYGFSQYTWNGFSKDPHDDDNDFNSFDNDNGANAEQNKDLLRNEPE